LKVAIGNMANRQQHLLLVYLPVTAYKVSYLNEKALFNRAFFLLSLI